MTSKGTPGHTVRVPDEIWKAANARAQRENRSLSDVIREHLIQYGHPEKDQTT